MFIAAAVRRSLGHFLLPGAVVSQGVPADTPPEQYSPPEVSYECRVDAATRMGI